MPVLKQREVDERAPLRSVRAAAAAALPAESCTVRMCVVRTGSGKPRSIDDDALRDHRFEIGAMVFAIVIAYRNHLRLAVLQPHEGRRVSFEMRHLAARSSVRCGA